jgi:ketosteroid isomerase-like protein
VIIEFRSQGSGQKTRRPYNQRYINVIRIRDGKIVAYRDYWNPLVALWTADKDGIPAELAGEQG